ncbi:general secretion pathway protein J (plasmid) [Nitratiruptor sp. YY08-26]|nr:general secretion pathway protein J [Nitratiruptor sp. YY08-13]BCD67125.1 general secretion pathway protein J [Nitratiruptor sp. YY08-26]
MCYSSMSKNAFTLIELMVSIALTVIVVLFLYKALALQTITNNVLTKNANSLSFQDKIFLLMYQDLSESNVTQISKSYNRDYDLLYLQTKNSLHAIPFPYVAYYVNAKKKTLVRLESAYPIKFPIPSEHIQYIYADVLIDEIEKFRIFGQNGANAKPPRELLPGEAPRKIPSNKKVTHSFLIYFNKNKKNYLFEIVRD